MNKPNNPPAFPVKHEHIQNGMSLLDYFAGQAIQGYLANASLSPQWLELNLIEQSYLLAQRMLEHREKLTP